MLEGIFSLSVWGYVAVTLVLTHITIVSVTVYLHRHQAHRALDLHPALSHFFRFWLWLTTGMITREWVAIHRKHHAKCETEEDPHSPQVYGIRKVLSQGAELYRAEARNAETTRKYGHGAPDDWIERKLYSRYNGAGITLMLAIDLVAFGVIGLTVWAIQMLWIPVWAAGVINGIGHYWGYRSYETADASTNIVPVGVLIGGEEMHNNHHAFPSSARFSSKWWEIDIGWFYIRLFERLGLARVKKIARRPVLAPEKAVVDMETVRAVVMNRFHVMADYSRTVMLPVLREEVQRADASCRQLLRRARGLLTRDESRLDAVAKDRLHAVLEQSHVLCTVYQYQRRLQALWTRGAGGHEQMVHALQEWCRQAEATGIQALQEFARTLRCYAVAPMPGRA
jgi:stearoyl-CoA desaturase (Delta-9 desaturase)